MEPSTKDRITEAALRLFSEKGYLGASLSDIAKQVGISKAALYKHFASKQEILDHIVARMDELDTERSQRFSMPGNELGGTAAYKEIPAEKIRAYSKAQFLHWTEEEFYCNFRRMLTVEQYNSAENAKLYAQYISVGPLKYMADIFEETVHNGQNSKMLALKFYAPMFFLYSLYDNETADDGSDKKSGAKKEILELLDKHIDDFFVSFPR